jgi:hypothetical protein
MIIKVDFHHNLKDVSKQAIVAIRISIRVNSLNGFYFDQNIQIFSDMSNRVF